jgi:uncharacterized protein YndB with AHSA1/START domain
MNQDDSAAARSQNTTKVERTSDREMVVTRLFDAPPHVLFEAWTRPDLFMRWWAPKSMGVPIRSCEMDVRTGGTYRLIFGKDGSDSFAFFGKYIEVVPNARLVWTNDEGEGEEGAVTTVTFEEKDGGTFVTFHELYPSKEALDESLVGMDSFMPEQFDQLDALLAGLGRAA